MASLKVEIEGVEIRPLRRLSDERGWLTEVFRSDEVRTEILPAMAYVSITHPGMSRGPHEHLRQTDMFCFVGPGEFELRLWDNRPESPTFGNTQGLRAGEKDPIVLVIPPGVVHAYKNVGRVDAMVINFPNQLYGGRARSEPVDEIRHEDDLMTPFKLE